jgi:hypothetical protein
MNSAANIPTDMTVTIKAEILNCKMLYAVARCPVTMRRAAMKWRDLCNTLHAMGLSVAHFGG